MLLSIKLGNFLYKYAFQLYRPLYSLYKNRQDAFEIALLKEHVHRNDVVLDIGANIGFYATIFASIVGGNGEVHCFEPDATNYNYLKTVSKKFNHVFINNRAVGTHTERLKFYTSHKLNVDHRTYKPEEYDKEFEIEAVSIDDYLSTRSTSGPVKVDFIKMDIQGFEMHAIKGMEKTLATNEGIKLLSEFWPYGLKQAGSSLTEYFDCLSADGFTCYLLENNSLTTLHSARVKELETLGENHFFNILASRNHV